MGVAGAIVEAEEDRIDLVGMGREVPDQVVLGLEDFASLDVIGIAIVVAGIADGHTLLGLVGDEAVGLGVLEGTEDVVLTAGGEQGEGKEKK